MLRHFTLHQALRDHAFLRGLEERHIAKLATLANEVHFEENEMVIMDRQQSQYFYLVISGSVIIALHAPVFTVSVLVLGPGEAFGWSALLDHQETLFQVSAREQTVALRMDGVELAQACRSDSELGVEILRRTLQVAAGRVQATEARLAEICGVRIRSSTQQSARSSTSSR